MIPSLLHLQGAAAIVSILLVTLTLFFTRTSSSAGGCVPGEREALISFKQSFADPSGRLSSWRGEHCCPWEGVRCDNRTGHVIELDLRGGQDYNKWITLRGETISSSITALRHLRYLDLSFHEYSSTPIPSFLGTLSSLSNKTYNQQTITFVQMSRDRANWDEQTTSVFLDIMAKQKELCHWANKCPTSIGWTNIWHSFNEITNLGYQKKQLQNKFNDLKRAYFNWRDGCHHTRLGRDPDTGEVAADTVWSVLPGGLRIHGAARIHDSFPGHKLLNFSSNNINGDTMGRLPECSWRKLQEIDFHGANLTGHIPVWIGNLTRLTYLDISRNMLIGDVPSGIGALSGLTYLSLGLNNFSGVLSKEHFSSLVNLEYLNLSQNSLKLDVSKDWVPPFKLKEGHFGSCVLRPQFPTWLRWQAGIDNLDISNTRINDVLPHWFWVVVSNASTLDLSRNQLSGGLPEKLELPFIRAMDLSRNSLAGQLPANLTAPLLFNLLLYNNKFTGTIPAYMCYDFLGINLANNKLTGDSPQYSSHFSLLQMVDLKNNNLSGEFPLFLQNAGWLSFLDLSNNKFFGSVPTWIADKMPNLEVLIPRSNMFHGHLPEQLTRFAGLHYLDVAHNNISGSIPSSLGRLRAMTHSYSPGGNNYSTDSISTFIKDRELNYTHELTQHIVLIDLSSNGFTGSIPKELYSLKGLRSLNLSNNQISGPIPDGIGDLKELESLDLSFN
ncbi:hypothetical protein HU200_050136 [Digitaria exilis]|uniref:Leucine-rich repeat-containing N-terminal plant-type domain-containing protein n=1 Tax=Digitaria exilis TaxID=1010633 RepID=A0A835ATP3_9POAL|nr:hypothetical protein HU200_050136 [Digitaria exilis]